MHAEEFDKKMAAEVRQDGPQVWLEVPHPHMRVQGLGFFETERRWCRLPSTFLPLLQERRPALVQLARHTAGASLEFITNSQEVWVRAEVESAPYMGHMTGVAQCGFDCYARLPEKQWILTGVSKFPVEKKEFCCCLLRDTPAKKLVRIHFPLYTSVCRIQIGLVQGACLELPPPAARSGIAFYGTSITQGGCASRPGMAYPAILSRELDVPVYNLGFSGNGVGTPELAQAICALPRLGALVVDIEANAAAEGLLERNLPAFLDAVRCLAPRLPVLLLSAPLCTTATWDQAKAADFERRQAEERRANGDLNIYFADGRALIGSVGAEATVDGCHLTDLGFWALAKGLAPVLLNMLE